MNGKKISNPTSDSGMLSKSYKELKKLEIKITNNPIKIWGLYLNRILNRRISSEQDTLKELFNILSYQRNANEKDSEIPSFTCHNRLMITYIEEDVE